MKSTKPTSISSRIDGRLAAYAAVAAATLAGPAISNVEATVITNNINLVVPNNADGVYLNFLSGATGTAAANVAGWDINPYLQNAVFTFFWPTGNSGGVDQGGAVYASLAPGSIISAASVFTASSGGGGPGSTINYQSTGIHTLGFRFTNETTGLVNYGYARISNTGPNGFPATILSYSYENSGGQIQVPVPEPTTFALLGMVAAGALGVREWRRRKAA